METVEGWVPEDMWCRPINTDRLERRRPIGQPFRAENVLIK